MGEGTNQMDIIKIGLIGAGTNMVEKHIPGFLKIPGVEMETFKKLTIRKR